MDGLNRMAGGIVTKPLGSGVPCSNARGIAKLIDIGHRSGMAAVEVL